MLNFDVWRHNDVIIFRFCQQKDLKNQKRHNDIIMTSNCKFMLAFELSGPNLVSIPNFSSISLQMADFFWRGGGGIQWLYQWQHFILFICFQESSFMTCLNKIVLMSVCNSYGLNICMWSVKRININCHKV